MEKRILGKTGIEIAPIVFGGNVFGWTLDEQASFKILDAFVDLGFNAIDTANQYSYWVPGNSGGESETIIGRWQQKNRNRERIVLMTKVGGVFADNPNPNTRYSHIVEQVEASLKRLQTDYIDVYQTHFDDVNTPVEETLRAYEELVQAGKVKFIGASNISPERLQESLACSDALSIAKYQTLQPEYNLYSRENFEKNYQAIAQDNGLAVLPYYSLASGFLTGKYQQTSDFSKSPRGTKVQADYWNERGERIIKALTYLAEEYKTTPAAIALAWLLAQPAVTAPIASATKLSHLDPFMDALDIELRAEAILLLQDASKY